MCSDVCAVNKVTVCGITAAIKKLKPKLTSGTDYVPNFIVKGCLNLCAPILEHIFSISLTVYFHLCGKSLLLFLCSQVGYPCYALLQRYLRL